MRVIRYGADRLAADPGLLAGARHVALATNDAARAAADPESRTRVVLLRAGVPLVRLFSPEHGLGATSPDGRAVGNGVDALTGLPVWSLYGERFAPPPESLADVDAVLFDIPDVGIRFYTYLWTLTHIIDACACAGAPLWMLDRPNPLSGALETVEGPVLEIDHASFIGRHTIPIRFALTLGEFARLWQRERRPDADVRVIPCEGWERAWTWQRTGLPFVATSPALTNPNAVLLYGGLCLFEATNLSVARGAALSFQAIGAPWLDAERVIARFHERGIEGVSAVRAGFTPTVGPHAHEICDAVRIIITNAERARPVGVGIALLADVAATHRERFAWADYPTAANPSGRGHLERLVGTSTVHSAIARAPESVDQARIRDWTTAPGWEERWRSVLLYD
jgi:uncharacterized protein YbbC (DUF1343 family)